MPIVDQLVCKWTKTDWHSYTTGCEVFLNLDGGNLEYYKYKFCPYCGREIEESEGE